MVTAQSLRLQIIQNHGQPRTARQMVGGQEYDAKLAEVVQGAAGFLDAGAVISCRARSDRRSQGQDLRIGGGGQPCRKRRAHFSQWSRCW
jgi:hypothetical protein